MDNTGYQSPYEELNKQVTKFALGYLLVLAIGILVASVAIWLTKPTAYMAVGEPTITWTPSSSSSVATNTQ